MFINKLFAARRKRAVGRNSRALFLEPLETRLPMHASLSGMVFVDADRDGVHQFGEIGIPGAVISLTGADSSGNAVNRSVLSGSDGSYLFEELEPGTYRVSQRQPTAIIDGSESTTLPGVLIEDDLVSNIELDVDENLGGINFGEQGLRPEYVNITWFFASAPSQSTLLRESVAIGEEANGDLELAGTIRDELTDVPANISPTATNDTFTVSANTVLTVAAATGVLANDSDPNGDVLTASIVEQASRGSVALAADGAFTYTPDTDYEGVDTFTYRASDGTSSSSLATVSITVTNSSPTNTFNVDENSPRGTRVGQLDPEGEVGEPRIFEIEDTTRPDQLRLAADDHLSGNPAAPVVLVEYLDIQCPACRAIHPVVAQLEEDFANDLLVVRRHLPLTNIHPNAFAAARVAEAADRQGRFTDAVDIMFENQDEWESVSDPQSLFESYMTQLGLDIDQLRSDLNDPALDARINRDLAAAGALGATSTPSFFLNGNQISNPGTLEAFTPLIQAEVNAVDDVFSLDRLTGEIFVADSAALDFETSPTFSLVASARNGNSISINATVNLNNVNDQPPIPQDDQYVVDENSVLTVPAATGVLSNDQDPDGDDVTASHISGPAQGSLSLGDDGSFTYTPDTDFSGTDSFVYSASDGSFSTNAIATITVTQVNSAAYSCQRQLPGVRRWCPERFGGRRPFIQRPRSRGRHSDRAARRRPSQRNRGVERQWCIYLYAEPRLRWPGYLHLSSQRRSGDIGDSQRLDRGS